MARDNRDALARAQASLYDLVLMDLQMPVMSGIGAIRAIRALPGWQARPILALTANAFVDDRLACQAAGMNDVIVKPMEVAAFHAVRLRWLDQQALGGALRDSRLGDGLVWTAPADLGAPAPPAPPAGPVA